MFVDAVEAKMILKKKLKSIVIFTRICCCSTNDSAIKKVTGKN